jgi:hypothetical protein
MTTASAMTMASPVSFPPAANAVAIDIAPLINWASVARNNEAYCAVFAKFGG